MHQVQMMWFGVFLTHLVCLRQRNSNGKLYCWEEVPSSAQTFRLNLCSQHPVGTDKHVFLQLQNDADFSIMTGGYQQIHHT